MKEDIIKNCDKRISKLENVIIKLKQESKLSDNIYQVKINDIDIKRCQKTILRLTNQKKILIDGTDFSFGSISTPENFSHFLERNIDPGVLAFLFFNFVGIICFIGSMYTDVDNKTMMQIFGYIFTIASILPISFYIYERYSENK